MRGLSLLLCFCAAGWSAPGAFRQSGFAADAGGRPEGWATWSARAETAPRTFVDAQRYRTRMGSLAISGASNAAEHGGWERRVSGIEPRQWYRFTAYCRAEAVSCESWQVVARLDWRTSAGGRAGQPEYVYRAARDGAWTRVWVEAPAPEKAAEAVIQLYLSNAPQATVWWDDVALEPIAAPGTRNVTVVSVNLRPANTGSAAASVGQFLSLAEKLAPEQTDVILLPEGITVVGTGKTYAEVAESIPGATTARLGELARKQHTYVAAGIYEREGSAIYNTAVLIDRTGSVAGKYRKVYLPREEIEAGLTPGFDYPVFRTDFGTVGLMICYDVFFADPARALTSRGAEIVLMPIWGGDETLAKARAIENKVFLIASGYDHPTYVMDPDGERLSVAAQRGTAAVATIDLNRRYLDPWLGDMHGRRMKELRLDVQPPVPGLER